MANLLRKIFGVPLSPAEARAVVEDFARMRGIADMRATVGENLAHITGKSGALLQAQGIFFVVATYAQGVGWPPTLAFISILLLVVAALMVMTNLRSVFIGPDPNETDMDTRELGMLARSAQLAARRGALFNGALYLTFLSVVLLGAGAIALQL